MDLDEVYTDGYEARSDMAGLNSCPHECDSSEFDAWMSGYQDADDDIEQGETEPHFDF